MNNLTTDLVLMKLDTARFALSEAKTIQETKVILDVAAAAEILAKRQQLGEEAINYATSIKVEALAQLGRMLKEIPKNAGARGIGKSGVPVQNPTLADMGLDKKTSKLAQDIASLPDEQLEKVKNGIITISKSLEKAHISYNSGENEWYTPKEYIDVARDVMGSIDVDPASSDVANKTIMATTYFTKETDGLKQHWVGNIWLNPPYSQPLIVDFLEKLIFEYESRNIKQACVLVNNATETKWGQRLLSHCRNVCFPKGRIWFVDVNGGHKNGNAPLQGQMILYFGDNGDRFSKLFGRFGTILWKEE